MDILQLKDVQKTFVNNKNKITIINNCSSLFKQGITYGLIGVSGIGKSTLMHIISGLDAPSSGTVLFNKKNIYTFSPAERARCLQLVTQTPHMIKELTVYENCKIVGSILDLTAQETDFRLQELFSMLGLDHIKDWNVGQLSGGQLQRVALIRALLAQPSFLLADEPTGNLDEKTGKQLLTTLLVCQKKWNMGLLISSHNSYITSSMEVVFTIKDGILSPVL